MTDVDKTVAALELLGFKRIEDFPYHFYDGADPNDIMLSFEHSGKYITVGVNKLVEPEQILRSVLFQASKLEKKARNARLVATLDDFGIRLNPVEDWQ